VLLKVISIDLPCMLWCRDILEHTIRKHTIDIMYNYSIAVLILRGTENQF
jgi:hypothetical protein